MTDQAEAQAALDAVRHRVAAVQVPGFPGLKRPYDGAHYAVNKTESESLAEVVLAALENLDARLKALEGK